MQAPIYPKYRNKVARSPKKKKEVTSQVSDLVSDLDFVGIREGFLDAIAELGANERGDPIKLSGWYKEVLIAIADFRIAITYLSGCAQTGKTLSHTLLLCYCMEKLGLNPLWSYDLQASLNIQVPSNFRPVVDSWLENAGKAKSSGAKNNTLFQVGKATTQFTYVSTSDSGKNKGGRAAAGGIAVGVSRDILFKEERSQYPMGAADPLRRRLDAGLIPTRPERELGTPGGGMGIEAEIEAADHHFFPHAECGNCHETVALHPKGALLKPSIVDHPVLGKTQKYLSESGRPVQWFHHNEQKPVETAYFGCPFCQAELSKEARSKAWYQCLTTGIELEDYLNNLEEGLPSRRHKIGLTISPLLRIEAINTAAAIIEEGLTSHNTADWQQQRLGLPSEAGTNNITLELLRLAIAAPVPINRQPNVSLGGIDCGRGEHWLTMMDFYLPPNYFNLKLPEVIEKTVRFVRYASPVSKTGLIEKVKVVKTGIVDNEPDRDWAAGFCQDTGWSMADQKSGLKDAVRKGVVIDGGVRYPCYDIRNEKFLKTVLNGFVLQADDGYPLYRFPENFSKYLGNLKSDRNLFKHLMAMQYDAQMGAWKRPADHVDDFYMAFAFCEVAFYLWLLSEKAKLKITSWTF
ncbi:hypothetical protein Xen7305DRAFT_00008080 [Xenococcus sp. PCC 7305]|uniref:hypothetical protein n=1 Tax=Xenococcus sp. PCC 7305 TaxID=102125 RepID=UPI0002ABFF52|nr:hypothetical protein [Xenococcus sp. PCC 7305]ELS01106.1 hypothetical protein Xen7305DRAFT_00008080 [Xenococcus sp. PCC 7305]